MKRFALLLFSLSLALHAFGADKNSPLPRDFIPLKVLAEKGDAEAQARLANYYSWGKRVKVDRIEAFKWASRSAKQANLIAKYHVASAHLDGVGIPQDTVKAEVLYKQAAPGLLALAKQGNAHAQFCLGQMYLDGRGLNRNEKEAFQWTIKAAEQGLPEAQGAIGFMYGVKKDEKESLMWLRKAEKQNLSDVKGAIGMLHIEGKLGVKKNAAKGLQLLKESVEQGSPIGMLLLGTAYISEEASLTFGVEMDAEKGVELIRNSAKQGESTARFLLGTLLVSGQAKVQKDVKNGLKLLHTAAAQNNPRAKWVLANFYLSGRFELGKDVAKGMKLFHESAEQGHPQSQYSLANIYFAGQPGVEKDLLKSYAWADIAASNDHEQAKQAKKSIARRLTPEQIAKAEAMAKEMIKNNPRLLK